MKSKKQMCVEFGINLNTLNKIIKYLNLQSIIKPNLYGKETQYYDDAKIKKFMDTNKHNNHYGYNITEISKIIGVCEKSIKNVISYLKLNDSEYICDNELNLIKQFYKEHKDDYKTFFQHKTNIEKYGSKCPLADKNIQLKSEKTCLEKYGANNYNQTEESKIRHKQTSVKKYGVENPSQSKAIREKIKNTNLERYGVENPNQCNDVKKKIKEANLKKIQFAKFQNLCSVKELADKFDKDRHTIIEVAQKLNMNIITFENDDRYYISQFDLHILEDYFSKTEMSGTSYSEKQIVDFIKSIYNGDVIENSKKIISPKELDIYIPSKNLAIEFDGLHWHDENHIENRYHLNKTLACNEKGIDLIHVFEDDWLYKKTIVKSMISSRLGIYQQKIFARKCSIKEIEKSQAESFFNENHLQGFAQGTLYLGLFYNDELVQAIIINKKGWHDGNVELTRMVTKLNTQVIGGFGKLMKHVSDYMTYDSISSYVYRAWFNGKGYLESGFKVVKENPPSYSYVVNGKRIHKSYFRKDKIKRLYENKELDFYDNSKSEHENMMKNKIYRIYDCGTVKMKYES